MNHGMMLKEKKDEKKSCKEAETKPRSSPRLNAPRRFLLDDIALRNASVATPARLVRVARHIRKRSVVTFVNGCADLKINTWVTLSGKKETQRKKNVVKPTRMYRVSSKKNEKGVIKRRRVVKTGDDTSPLRILAIARPTRVSRTPPLAPRKMARPTASSKDRHITYFDLPSPKVKKSLSETFEEMHRAEQLASRLENVHI